MRTILNLALVWLFTGLWHGVGGNYLIWAGILFILIVNERLWMGKWLEKSRILCHFYLVGVILLSWVPFAVNDFSEMVAFFGKLFGYGARGDNPADYQQWAKDYAVLLGAGVLFATPLPAKLWKKIRESVVADILLVVLFWFAIYYISTAAQDPFLYFKY